MFNLSSLNTMDSIKTHWQNMFDLYYAATRPMIPWILTVTELYHDIDMLAGYSTRVEDILEHLTSHSMIYKTLLQHISNQNAKKMVLTVFADMLRTHFDKLRQELMTKIVSAAQAHINDRIVNFDINVFQRTHTLTISKYSLN